MALVQCACSAASTAGVFLGHGPSSKVSTTSPSRRKSWVLKCSKPKPGPPVVSISTTRDMPSAFGLPGQDEAAAGAVCAGVGACAVVAGAPTGAAANEGVFCASTIGTLGAAGVLVGAALGTAALCWAAFCAASGGEGGLAATAGAGVTSRSSNVVTTVRSVGAAWAGEL